VDREHRAELIARYRAGVGVVDTALADADDADLDAVPSDGDGRPGW
jgi:hypothetical protein